MKIITVRESEANEMLDNFFENGVFTFEGLDLSTKEKVKDFTVNFEKIARETGFTGDTLVAYKVTGEMMNRRYELTGENAYADDINIICIPGYYNSDMKLKMGARWFDDVCCSNAIRENAIRCGQEPDFG
ncbi:MAG: hypothetical protein IKP50_00295 [Bacilli bacterium]|nr:hypothetical protein [Bacilli bacterium]